MLYRLIPRTLAVLAAAALAACGGGGGGGSVPGGGGGGGTPTSSTATIAANKNAPATGVFATIQGGISAAVTVPATNSGSGTLTGTLTATPPTGVPVVSSTIRAPRSIGGTLTPIAYVSVSSPVALVFSLTPGVSITVPSGTSGYGYLGYYSASTGWTAVAGATTLVNGQYTFSPLDASYTISPGVTAVFAVFTSPTLVAVNPPGNNDGTNCAAYQQGTLEHRRAPRITASGAALIVPNQLYVTTRGSQRVAESVTGTARAVRSLPLGAENGLVHQAITLPAGADATRVAAQLRATAGVVDVQPVHRRFLTADSVANDTLLNNDDQWYLYKTNVDPGRGRSRTVPASRSPSSTPAWTRRTPTSCRSSTRRKASSVGSSPPPLKTRTATARTSRVSSPPRPTTGTVTRAPAGTCTCSPTRSSPTRPAPATARGPTRPTRRRRFATPSRTAPRSSA